MSAKRARRLQEQHDFLGRPEESRPGVLIPHFFGAVFQSHRTHLNPHPIPIPIPIRGTRSVIWTSCRRGVNVNDDTEAFAPIKLCFINARIYGEWQRQWQQQQLWSNDLLQFSSYLNFFEIPLVDGRQSAALC